MPAFFNMTYADYGSEAKPYGETSRFRVPGESFTAANFDAQNALIATLAAAVQAVSLGAWVKDMRELEVSAPDTGPAASPLAQREKKWKIFYHDVDRPQDKYHAEIPCADLTLLEAHSERMDITTALSPGLALKEAFEAYVHPVEYPAHDVVVDEIVFMGKNT